MNKSASASNQFAPFDGVDIDTVHVESKEVEMNTADDDNTSPYTGSGRQRLQDEAEDNEEEDEETEEEDDHGTKKSKVNDIHASASFLNSQTQSGSSSSSSSSSSSMDTVCTPNPNTTAFPLQPMGFVPEAYWMQNRQSELEAKYNMLTVMDTFDSYNVVEWIELLSCMRGMTIKSITLQAKTSDLLYHKKLVEGKIVAMTMRTIYMIYSELMTSTFMTRPAVPAGYSIPTVQDINYLHSHIERLVRSFTLLVETEEAKKTMTTSLSPSSPVTMASMLSGAGATVLENRTWLPASAVWQQAVMQTVNEYLHLEPHTCIEDYLVYYHTQLNSQFSHLTEVARQTRLKEIFTYTVADVPIRQTTFDKFAAGNNHAWGTMTNTHPDSCIAFIRQQFRDIWESEFPVRRLRDFPIWLREVGVKLLKKDPSQAGKLIVGKLVSLLDDVKAVDNTKAFPAGGPNPNPMSIYLEAFLVDQWHEAMASHTILNGLVSYIQNERMKLLKADPTAITLTISNYFRFFNDYVHKKDSDATKHSSVSSSSGSTTSNTSSSSSSSSGTNTASQNIQVNYVQDGGFVDRPMFLKSAKDCCRFKSHTDPKMKYHHWQDCLENPQSLRNTNTKKWVSDFHFPAEAAKNKDVDPPRCGSKSVLLLDCNVYVPTSSSGPRDNTKSQGGGGGSSGSRGGKTGRGRTK